MLLTNEVIIANILANNGVLHIQLTQSNVIIPLELCFFIHLMNVTPIFNILLLALVWSPPTPDS